MAGAARVTTTVVVVPMDSAEDEAAGAAVDQLTMIILELDHSVITEEVVTTGAAVEIEADTTAVLPLPSVQDRASRISTSCAILPPNLGSS